MNGSTRWQPPPLLVIAVIIVAIKGTLSALMGLALLIATLGGTAISIPVLLSEGETEALPGALGAGALFTTLLVLFLIVQVVKLWAAWGSWQGERAWMVVLLVMTAVSLLLEVVGGGSSCCCLLPLSAVLDLLVFAGVVHALSLAPGAN
jgi:hypothetical protein